MHKSAVMQLVAAVAILGGVSLAARCPSPSDDYAVMALDGVCDKSYNVSASMSVLLGCEIEVTPSNAKPTINPSNFKCQDDSGVYKYIKVRRALSSSLGAVVGKVSMLASDAATHDQNNVEDPASTLAECSRDGQVRCLPGPCAVLDISYYQDPTSLYNMDAHGTLLAPKDKKSVSRNFEPVSDEGFTAIYGYSQCDPMAGTRLMDYTGSISNFSTVGIGQDFSSAAKQAMQRLAAEVRSDAQAFGTEAGLELWPDTLPIPPVFHINEQETNPLYMYCKDGNVNATNKECQDLRTYMDPNNNAKVLPSPMPWQCSRGQKPPPIVWIKPSTEEGSSFTVTTDKTGLKDALISAGKRRLEHILDGNAYDPKQHKDNINQHFAYTYEPFDANAGLPSGFHPLKVRCRGSSSSNPHDRSTSTIYTNGVYEDGDGYIEITNCQQGSDNQHRFFFGSLSAPYSTDITPVLVYPQLPDSERVNGSIPGAFSPFPQIVGLIFTPQLSNPLVSDYMSAPGTSEQKENAAKQASKTKFRQAISDFSAGSSVSGWDDLDLDLLEYDDQTCHVFSEDQRTNGGCSWLPPYVPPGICLDARAQGIKDILVPAASSRVTLYGADYGLLDFDRYECTNFWVSLTTHDYSAPDTLQHGGPIDCLRGRINGDGFVPAKDVIPGKGGNYRNDRYSDIQNRKVVQNFLFRMSEPDDASIEYAMEGTASAQYSIQVVLPTDPSVWDSMSTRLQTSTGLKTYTYRILPAFVKDNLAQSSRPLTNFINRHCAGKYEQKGGMPFLFPKDSTGYNGDWWSPTGNSTRGFCDWTQLTTDRVEYSSHSSKRSLEWLTTDKEWLLPSGLTATNMAKSMCPESRCQDSKYGQAISEASEALYPWGFINNDLHHAVTYHEASCGCCSYSDTRLFWYEHFNEWFSDGFTGLPKSYRSADCTNNARPNLDWSQYHVDFLPNEWQPIMPPKGQMPWPQSKSSPYSCQCADQWSRENDYYTGYVFTDLFYSGKSTGNLYNVPYAHTYDSTDPGVQRVKKSPEHDSYLTLNVPMTTATPFGMRWHFNYSMMSAGFAADETATLHDLMTNYGYGTSSADQTVQILVRKVCSPQETDECAQMGNNGLDLEILLGRNAAKTSYKENSLFTTLQQTSNHPDVYTTNMVRDAHITTRFPEKIAYNGYSFARTRSWTSSVAPGEACDCQARKPEYRCYDALITDAASSTEVRLNVEDTLSRLELYVKSTMGIRDAGYLDMVKQSIVIASCGFFWSGDNSALKFGLHMYGRQSPFYVYQHNVYSGDYYTSANLDALVGDNPKASQTRMELDTLLFNNPIDKSTLVSSADYGGVWEFDSTCLRWPYGHAHIESFNETDAKAIVADSLLVQRTIPGVSDQTITVRKFPYYKQHGYCDQADFSQGGKGTPESAFVHCNGDPYTTQERLDFCQNNKHAGSLFGGLRINAPPISTMCNDRVCLYVPGHPTAPTLRDFMHSSIDFTNKTVLVTPFNASTVEYGMFFEFLVNDHLIEGMVKEDNGVSFTDKSAFVVMAAMPPSYTVEDVKNVSTGLYNIICPQGRNGQCLQNVVPGDGAESSVLRYVDIDTAMPPMQVTDIRIGYPGVTIESAVDARPMFFRGREKGATMYTRFNVGAPNVHIGKMTADQTPCTEGFRCAAVVFSGDDVRGGSTTEIMALHTKVPVMVLGLDSVAFRVTTSDLDADGLAVDVAPSSENAYVVGIAASTGNITVSYSGNDPQTAIVQPMGPLSLTVASPNQGFSIFNLSAATGLFGAAEERLVYSRPPDQEGVLATAFITFAALLAATLVIHIGLFVKAKVVCTWIVAHALRGKTFERQPEVLVNSKTGKVADSWSVQWSSSRQEYVVYVGNFRTWNPAPKVLDPLTTVVARVLCDFEGGCERYSKHKGLVAYAKNTIT